MDSWEEVEAVDKKYFVYIIRSESRSKTYTGFTTDLDRRIQQHNDNLGGYTKSRGPWRLVWYCVFSERDLAENFERYLKGGSGYAFAKKRLAKCTKVLRSSEGAK